MPARSSGRPSAELFAVLAAALIVLSGCAVKAAPGGDGEGWGAYLRDNARSNHAPVGAQPPLALLWDESVSAFRLYSVFPKEELASPAVSGGVVYAAASKGRLYAFDLKDGSVYWKLDAGSPLDAAPAVHGARVYIGGSDGVMRSVDRATGRELWRFSARSEIVSSPVVEGDRLYFSSSDDRVYALSSGTGEKLWSYSRATFKTVSTRLYASSAYSQGRLYHLFSDGTLVCLWADTGRELWSKDAVKDFAAAEPARRTPLVSDSTVYFIDGSNAVMALSAETGEVKGIYNLIKARDFILPDNKTIVIAGSDRILALDRTTGTILWDTGMKYAPVASIFSSGSHVYALSNYTRPLFGIKYFKRERGRVQALRLSDGGVAWDRRLAAATSASGASAGRTAAIISDKGIIEVFGASPAAGDN